MTPPPTPASGGEDKPYRLVDAENYGWLVTGSGDYRAPLLAVERMTLAEITAKRGPWRPVEPISDEDEQDLTTVFAACGRKTIATLAAALEVVHDELRESKGGLGQAHDSTDYAERTLTAGREGSWESAVLMEVIWFGNSLNLAPVRRNAANSIAARRAAGPAPRRVNKDGRAAIAAVLRRWVTDPHRYTEVAETLAGVVSRYADRAVDAAGGPQVDAAGYMMSGWKAVADQWLQPGGMDRVNFVSCYRLFYSLSRYFNPHLL